MTTDEQIQHWKERAEKAEADLARLREARDADGEFQSEIVSDAKDPSVNVSWMRCSPDLPKYVRRLEAACAEMRQALYEISIQECIGIEHVGVCCIEESAIISMAEDALAKTDCGKVWLSPEKVQKLLGLIDGAKIAVELFPSSPSQVQWRKRWLEDARQALEDTK